MLLRPTAEVAIHVRPFDLAIDPSGASPIESGVGRSWILRLGVDELRLGDLVELFEGELAVAWAWS
jgi:hypothetical protein